VTGEERSNEELRRDAAYRLGQLQAHAKILADEHGRPWLAEQIAASATVLDELSSRLAAALARIEADKAEQDRLRGALLSLRSIGAHSGTNINAWNEAFDVIDRALAAPAATPEPTEETQR
jgi:hypothetical protein